jgi:hypothetical protein
MLERRKGKKNISKKCRLQKKTYLCAIKFLAKQVLNRCRAMLIAPTLNIAVERVVVAEATRGVALLLARDGVG